MTNEWNRICKESRTAYPQFYIALRVPKKQYNGGEMTSAEYELAIVRQLQQVIGDRPQARTFWALKKMAARLEALTATGKCD